MTDAPMTAADRAWDVPLTEQELEALESWEEHWPTPPIQWATLNRLIAMARRTDTDLRAATAEGAEAMREAAAKVAEWAHMVPPDGGSPTEAECAVAETAAEHIRALPIPGTDALAAKIAEAVERALEKEERSHSNTIDQRDHAEAIINELVFAVLGEWPEWSSHYQFADAVSDVQVHMAALARATEAPA